MYHCTSPEAQPGPQLAGLMDVVAARRGAGL
jgi:hypothetical protein